MVGEQLLLPWSALQHDPNVGHGRDPAVLWWLEEVVFGIFFVPGLRPWRLGSQVEGFGSKVRKLGISCFRFGKWPKSWTLYCLYSLFWDIGPLFWALLEVQVRFNTGVLGCAIRVSGVPTWTQLPTSEISVDSQSRLLDSGYDQ